MAARPFFFVICLLGAENPVAGVAQAGDDVGVLVQPLIQGSQVDFHIRVGLLHCLHALGAADDVHHHNVPAAVALQEVNGRHGAAAGGQQGGETA